MPNVIPTFSAVSLQRLQTCHPELQLLLHEAIKHVEFVVLEGHRDKAAQDAAVASGKSKDPWPTSRHNLMPSQAVDIGPWPIDFSNVKRFYYLAGVVCGLAAKLYESGTMKYRVRWGGCWSGDMTIPDEHGLVDLPHIQLEVI